MATGTLYWTSPETGKRREISYTEYEEIKTKMKQTTASREKMAKPRSVR